MRGLYLVCLLLAVVRAAEDPSRFVNFFIFNRMPSGLPLSYYVPDDYFVNVPANQRPDWYKEPMVVPACRNQSIPPERLNAYTFQTEEFLSRTGLNLYDGAVWSIALALSGTLAPVQDYQTNVLLAHKTVQLGNIKADAPCRGIIAEGECTDPAEVGGCGLCYGPNKVTLQTENAYFFRMIGDIWSYEGTTDLRCPELGLTWIWNDWRPVTGENAWANLIGPLQVAFIAAKGNVDLIADTSTELRLATSIIPGIQAMMLPNGAVLYSPYNTWDSKDENVGATVSVENNASLLSGIRALLYILQRKTTSQYKPLIPVLQDLNTKVTAYMLSSYDASTGFFRQGGRYNRQTQSYSWGSGVPLFSVDCQTWVMTILGVPLIDQTYGPGTAAKVWETTKRLGGYLYNANTGRVQGVGFTTTQPGQNIFSGEWSFGALNMLNVFLKQYTDQAILDVARRDIDDIRGSIENRLTSDLSFPGGAIATAVHYSNVRYDIPFGWWANPLPSTASTGWAYLVDSHYNPFVLGGGPSY